MLNQNATPHTHMAGMSSSWLPLISATITMDVIGTRMALARKPAMPTSANSAGSMPVQDGSTSWYQSPVASPSAQPHTSAGANTPPEPPEPTVNDVARTLMKKNAMQQTGAMRHQPRVGEAAPDA